MTVTHLAIPVEELPPWADVIAVDCDGSICVFEEGAYFSPTSESEKVEYGTPQGEWYPVDEFDGLKFQYVGKLNSTFTDEEASKLCFKMERKPGSKAETDRLKWSNEEQ